MTVDATFETVTTRRIGRKIFEILLDRRRRAASRSRYRIDGRRAVGQSVPCKDPQTQEAVSAPVIHRRKGQMNADPVARRAGPEGPERVVTDRRRSRRRASADHPGDVESLSAVVEEIVVDADGHPGYLTTSRMVTEAALLLADGDADLPDRAGHLTPALALGTAELDRFAQAGVRIRAA